MVIVLCHPVRSEVCSVDVVVVHLAVSAVHVDGERRGLSGPCWALISDGTGIGVIRSGVHDGLRAAVLREQKRT